MNPFLSAGILYGMGVEALADKLGVSSKEASTYRSGFLTAFPGVTKWIDSTQRACQSKGYVTTLCGRRRYLDHINNGGRQRAKAERQAVNSVCQVRSI
jgi:DNA polymerase I-like protein with 3'-5' exonuclease and polymerase domains